LDYIEQATRLDMQEDNESFDWIIGANTMDSDTLRAISDMKQADKQKSRV
jgi:hypothetical protein